MRCENFVKSSLLALIAIKVVYQIISFYIFPPIFLFRKSFLLRIRFDHFSWVTKFLFVGNSHTKTFSSMQIATLTPTRTLLLSLSLLPMITLSPLSEFTSEQFHLLKNLEEGNLSWRDLLLSLFKKFLRKNVISVQMKCRFFVI